MQGGVTVRECANVREREREREMEHILYECRVCFDGKEKNLSRMRSISPNIEKIEQTQNVDYLDFLSIRLQL